jgi:alpha-tubulin suppressor-like RCC1 family protein
VVAIAAGDYHTCALTSAGAAKCWGANARGQLGDGTTHGRHAPVAVSGLASGVTAIAADRNHSCALTIAGAVKCWGLNAYGELGDGTTTRRLTPVAVSGLAGSVTAISAGETHSCALTSAGAVECWGGNREGALGDGTRADRHTPVAVSGLGSGVKAITARGSFYDGSPRGYSCALTNTGRAKCWGWNLYGQLGDGTTTDRHKPVAVIGFGGAFKCLVPNVLGTPLAKAKTRIVRAHCRVGTVTRVASPKKKDTVVGESPRPGKRLKKGAKVKLKVSRGRS